MDNDRSTPFAMVLAISLHFLGILPCHAQELHWQKVGAWRANEFTFDPSGVQIAGSWYDSIRTSTDLGLTWHAQPSPGPGFQGVAIDSSGIALAGIIVDNSYQSIIRSADHGRSWTTVFPEKHLGYVSFAFADSGHVFCGVNITSSDSKSIYHSTDQGLTWKPISVGLNVLCPVVVACRRKVILANDDFKIFRSTDFGATWNDVYESASEVFLNRHAHSGNIYAEEGNHLLVSHDDGASWSIIPGPTGVRIVDDIVAITDTILAVIAYYGTPSGGIANPHLFLSRNEGRTWADVSPEDRNIGVIGFCPPNYLFAVTDTSGGTYRASVPLMNPSTSVSFGEDTHTEVHKFSASCYPNPFNPQTTISYSLPQESFVTVTIYNMLGQKIVTLMNEKQPVGHYTATWNGGNNPSGVYLYRISAGQYIETRKMLFLR